MIKKTKEKEDPKKKKRTDKRGSFFYEVLEAGNFAHTGRYRFKRPYCGLRGIQQ